MEEDNQLSPNKEQRKKLLKSSQLKINNNYIHILEYVGGMMRALPDQDRTEAIQTHIKQIEDSFSAVTNQHKARHLCLQLLRVQRYNKVKESKKNQEETESPFPKTYKKVFKEYIYTLPDKYRVEVLLSLQISINLAVISYCRRTQRLFKKLKE